MDYLIITQLFQDGMNPKELAGYKAVQHCKVANQKHYNTWLRFYAWLLETCSPQYDKYDLVSECVMQNSVSTATCCILSVGDIILFHFPIK